LRFRDLHEIEQKLKASNADLEKRVGEKTAELAEATAALMESADRLKLNMDLAGLVQWDYDVETELFTFGERFCALYGAYADQKEVTMPPSEYTRFLPADEAFLVGQHISLALAAMGSEYANQFEHHILRPEGEQRSILVRYGVVCGQDGLVIGIRGVNQDVTSQKMVEEALRNSEWEKSLILNIVDSHIIFYDTEMNILWANKAAGDSVAMASNDLLGRRCWETWHGRNEPCLNCPVIAARDTGHPHEAEIVTPDERIWSIRAYPIRNDSGQVIGTVEFTQDFTERTAIEKALRKANADLRESKEKYKAIVDLIDGYIYIASEDCRIRFVNEGMETVFGCREPGDFCYKAVNGMDSVCPECTAHLVFEGKTLRREHFCLRNRRWYFVVDSPIYQEDGSILRQTVGTDITDRKLFERQLDLQKRELEELNSSLEKRVEEEVAINREKDIILIQQNRQAALGEMLEHIAHQWKQPLNSICLYVQDIEAAWYSGEMTNEYLRETVSATTCLLDHMAQTIEVFRNFYKSDKERTIFCIKESLDSALTFVAAALRFQGIKVDLDIDPELTAEGYPKEYAQVLLNILTNARDVFAERKSPRPKIAVAAFAEGNKVVVTITDNAGGIPEEIMPRIFNLYFTTRQASGGSGIGLYMAKKIIEKNMMGNLTVSNVPCGARFRIEIARSTTV
jgi:signal transduction histidine kinase